MTRSDRIVLLAIIGAAVGLSPSTAFAAGEVDEAAARVLFAEGRKLAASGDYAAACPKFEESFRLDPGIGTNFNLADCWQHIGRSASAWARFLGVAAAAKAAGQGERAEVARARAAALEPKLSRLIVQVDAPADGLSVERDDGIPVGRASWGVPVPVDPGPHVVRATAPRKKPFSATVTVAATGGDTVTVAIAALEDLVAAVVAPPSAPAPPPAGPASLPVPPAGELVRTPRSRSPVPAIVAGAFGAAALATGAIFALQFRSVNDDAKQLCPGNTCLQAEKDRHTQLVSDARRDLTIAYLGAAVGGVALVTAALLWWRPGPLKPADSAATAATASVLAPRLIGLRRGAGLQLEARW